MGRRRKNDLAEVVDGLLEIAGFSWHVGAVVTVILAGITYKLFSWVERLQEQATSPLEVILEQFGFLLYITPGISLFFTLVFAVKTITTYVESKGLA